ncbi:hypothetical protein GCM10027185_05060 [Spirosoma pulveris]
MSRPFIVKSFSEFSNEELEQQVRSGITLQRVLKGILIALSLVFFLHAFKGDLFTSDLETTNRILLYCGLGLVCFGSLTIGISESSLRINAELAVRKEAALRAS